MDPDLLEALQHHLNLERSASTTYWAMAIWFAERDLRGFANHLKQESLEEQRHAGLFADYLIGRGQPVALTSLPKPCQQWSSPEEVLATVFREEADVTASLQQLYALAERAGDLRTTVFLDPIVQSQIEAENAAGHLLGRIRFTRNEPAALLVLDGELEAGHHAPPTLG